MKTVTFSVATTPEGREPNENDFGARAFLRDELYDLCNKAQVEVFTAALGEGIDDETGVHEPCVTFVVGVLDTCSMVGLRLGLRRVAKNWRQRSVAFVVGETEFLEVNYG